MFSLTLETLAYSIGLKESNQVILTEWALSENLYWFFPCFYVAYFESSDNVIIIDMIQFLF